MNHILIFGKNGFLAKNFCAFLTNKKINFTSYSSNEINLLDEESSKKLNLIKKDNYKIFFFSALTPDKGKDELTLIKNLSMIKNFFQYFQKDNIDHFFYISSDAVYDLNNEVITDKTIPNPQDLYGLMHLTREKIVENNLPKNKITILRLTGVYGLGDTHNSYGPNRFINSARKEKKIYIFGEGKDERSHIYINDVINILFKMLKKNIAGILCVASNKSYKFIYIANLIKDFYKKKNIFIDVVTNKNNNKITKRYFKNLLIYNKKFSLLKDDQLYKNIKKLISS
jgi:nucleoside-diphosphate-sugar epimerase